MSGYLLKDWILYRKQIIIFSLATLLLSAPTLIDSGELATAELIQVILCIMCVLIFLIIGMFEQGICEFDEQEKWKMYVISSPQTKSGIVLEKYIFTFIITSVVFLWCKILNIAVAMKNDIKFNIIWFIVILAAIQLILRAIELPLIIGFGSKCGAHYRMVVTYILMSVIFVYLLFGDLSIFGSEEKIIRLFVNMLSGDLKEKLRHFAEILLGGSVVLYFISFIISCKLYKRNI